METRGSKLKRTVTIIRARGGFFVGEVALAKSQLIHFDLECSLRFWTRYSARGNVDRAAGLFKKQKATVHMYILHADDMEDEWSNKQTNKNSIFYQSSIYGMYLGEIIDYIYIYIHIYINQSQHLSFQCNFFECSEREREQWTTIINYSIVLTQPHNVSVNVELMFQIL